MYLIRTTCYSPRGNEVSLKIETQFQNVPSEIVHDFCVVSLEGFNQTNKLFSLQLILKVCSLKFNKQYPKMHFINTDMGLCSGLLKETDWLIVFKEMSALYSENHKNHISSVPEKNASFLS